MSGVAPPRFAEHTRRRPVAAVLAATFLVAAALAAWKGPVAALPALFLLLALLGEALFVILGLIAVVAFFASGLGSWQERTIPLILEMTRITESPVFVAIPLFTVAGAIMTKGGISGRLVRLMKALSGWLPGGIAVSAILACGFFAALSGSSAVTIIAVGGMLAPSLEREFGRSFSIGLLTCCGAIGILAPPSLPLIVFGVLAEADIQKLFVAGVLPAVVSVVLLASYCIARGFLLKLPREPFDGRELLAATKHGIFALLLPFLMLGGIYGGIVTATEASILAVVYALVVEVGIHREVRIADLPGVIRDSIALVGSILIILLMALALTNWLTIEQIPEEATTFVRSVVSSRVGFLVAMNVLLLIVGCLMDIFSALVVMTPLLLPIARAYGIDPIHLGIIMVMNLEIGFATPPFGINLFISSAFFKQPVAAIFRAALPFLGTLLATLFLVTFVDALALQLVDWSGL